MEAQEKHLNGAIISITAAQREAMCNLLFVSTDSCEDLEQLPGEWFKFLPMTGEDEKSYGHLLSNSRKWNLTSRYGGCSCHYRHLLWESASLGFGAPEDWFGEDEEDVEATKHVYDVFFRLVSEGYRLDVIDIWEGDNDYADEGGLQQVKVSLRHVLKDQFRFMEGHRFELVP